MDSALRTSHEDAPNYDVEIEASDLLVDLADGAAKYGQKHEEYREMWMESLDTFEEFYDARYWMLEAVGGRRAYSNAIAVLQPGETWRAGRYLNDDGTVDVRGYMKWLSQQSSEAHEASHGPFTETRQADEAASAFARILSTLRDDYGIGWPRLDDLGGNPLPVDMP